MLVLTLAACGRVEMPPVPLPGAGAGNEGTERLFENRIWHAEDGEPGEFAAFLSDGTLIEGSCGGPARLAGWRWLDEGVLVRETEGGGTERVEIGMIGPNELILVGDPGGSASSRGYRRGRLGAC